MKVLVCGGRTFGWHKYPESWPETNAKIREKEFLYKTLSDLHDISPISLLINGGAQGADMLSSGWAMDNSVKTKVVYAEWHKYGKGAGPLRNQQMLLEKPDVVVAFPGGVGTADMIHRAKRAGVPVLEVEYDPN